MNPLIQFCEDKYVVSENIAEFKNSISNIVYLVASILAHRHGGNKITATNIFMIGIGSFLFHSFPSVITEMADEIWILFTVCDIINILSGRNYIIHVIWIYSIGILVEEFLIFYNMLTFLSLYTFYLLFKKYGTSERLFDIVIYMIFGKICWGLEHYGGYCDLHVPWHILSAISLYHVSMILV